MRSACRSVLAICTLLLACCGPQATEGGFDSANPAAKMYAIEDAARRGDVSAVRAIVEQLDSDDPAVRLLAIGALERLTGQTFGYRHYDARAERREAIERWRAALDQGEIVPMMKEGSIESASERPHPPSVSEDPSHG